MLSGRQQHQQSFNDSYTALILEEAEKLYNDLTTELTNRAIAAASDYYLPLLQIYASYYKRKHSSSFSRK
jgi:hypothetical protein